MEAESATFSEPATALAEPWERERAGPSDAQQRASRWERQRDDAESSGQLPGTCTLEARPISWFSTAPTAMTKPSAVNAGAETQLGERQTTNMQDTAELASHSLPHGRAVHTRLLSQHLQGRPVSQAMATPPKLSLCSPPLFIYPPSPAFYKVPPCPANGTHYWLGASFVLAALWDGPCALLSPVVHQHPSSRQRMFHLFESCRLVT